MAITMKMTANVELHPAYPARIKKVPGRSVPMSWLAFRRIVVDTKDRALM